MAISKKLFSEGDSSIPAGGQFSYGIYINSMTILGRVSHSLSVVVPKGKYLFMLVFVAASFLTSCDDDDDNKEVWQEEVDKLRGAVTSYTTFGNATTNGYNQEITGYVNNMGFHYLKSTILDDKFEVENPELLLYVPDGNGGLKFVAVEYAVPIADLDNPPPAPEGFKGDADHWEVNTQFSVWVLHAWVGVDNPDGIFHPHNPNIP